MSPHNKRQKRYAEQRTNHGTVTKYGLAGVGGYNFGRQAQGWHQNDIYLWVPQEPKKVLVKHWATARSG